jgi:predicted enzyme related to lactoylglutathione lyase
MDETLHQVYLMVSDLEASTQFYEEALNLAVLDRDEQSVEFDTGRCSLKIERQFDAETLAGFGLEPPGSNRGDGVIVVLQVADVDALYDRASEAGADVLTEPRDVAWGRRLFMIRDPHGYVLEISHPL